MREHNKNEFDWEGEGLTKEHKNKFDNIMIKSLKKALPSCNKYLEAAKKAAKEVVEEEIIFFTNPITNFPVVMKTYQTESRTISIVHNHERIRLNIITPKIKKVKQKDSTVKEVRVVNKNGMVNATAPGIVHSLDASLLSLVEQQVGFELSLIHDSIGAAPGDVKKVVEAYSKAMAIFANNNLFNMVFESMGSSVRVESTNTFKDEMGISKHCLV